MGLQQAVEILQIPIAAKHVQNLCLARGDVDDVVPVEQQVHERLGYVSPLLTRLPLPLTSEAAGSLEPAGA